MRKNILFMILSLSLFSCVTQTLPAQVFPTAVSVPTSNITYTVSPRPVASSTNEEVKVVSTVTPSPFPNEVFYFGATPSVSQVGGISGVFYYQYVLDETCPWVYSILRFYEDGLVMSVPVCEDATSNLFEDVWPEVSQWLNRENDDPTGSQGIYHISENKIWFTTAAENNPVVDYFGILTEDRLILNIYSHYNGSQHTEREFIFWDSSNSP